MPVCKPATPAAHEDSQNKSEEKHAPHSESIAELEDAYGSRFGLGKYRRFNGLGEENYRRRINTYSY
jgi:hypothetical protein